MGNMSEYRGLIVILTFVSIFLLFTVMAFSESPTMVASTSGNSPLNMNSTTVDPMSLIGWNETGNFSISPSTSYYAFTVGGWQFQITSYHWFGNGIEIQTYLNFLGINYDVTPMQWYSISGTEVSIDMAGGFQLGSPLNPALPLSKLDADYASGGIPALKYVARNSGTKITINFYFNTTTYAKPSDAWSAGHLDVIYNQDWSDRNTSINVLSFISMLFTFSLPGIDPYITAIVMFPIIAAVAYLAFIFVLRIVGAVFGGGGA